MALGILFILLLAYTILVVYKERCVFFKKNIDLLAKLNGLQKFENVWCIFSTLKIATSSAFMKVWLIPNGIVLVEDYSLNLNKTAKKAANTYLFTLPKKEISIDKFFFRHFGLIENFEIMGNGKIKIQARIHQQSVFKSIGFYPTSYKLIGLGA